MFDGVGMEAGKIDIVDVFCFVFVLPNGRRHGASLRCGISACSTLPAVCPSAPQPTSSLQIPRHNSPNMTQTNLVEHGVLVMCGYPRRCSIVLVCFVCVCVCVCVCSCTCGMMTPKDIVKQGPHTNQGHVDTKTQLQNFCNGSAKYQGLSDEGIAHFEFVMRIYKILLAGYRLLLHEHLWSSGSDFILELLITRGVSVRFGDQCFFGLVLPDVQGAVMAQKPPSTWKHSLSSSATRSSW